jgi:CheY-like chemotaxis protein
MMRMRFGKQVQTRILVVDDEPTIAVTLAAILKEEGYEVETAFSGEEAVRKAARFNPNLLITDLIMGAMNGMEAAARITAMLPDCRVLFFSGTRSFDELCQAAPKRLVYSFARKPMPVPDLLNAIAYLVSAVNTVYVPIDSFDGHNSDKRSPQRWHVARLTPTPGKSLARNSIPDTPLSEMVLWNPVCGKNSKVGSDATHLQ